MLDNGFDCIVLMLKLIVKRNMCPTTQEWYTPSQLLALKFKCNVSILFPFQAREDPEPVFDISECKLKSVPAGIYSLCKVFRKEKLFLQVMVPLSKYLKIQEKLFNLKANMFSSFMDFKAMHRLKSFFA